MQNWTFLILIEQASIKNITDPLAKAEVTTSYRKMIEEWGKANSYILENENYYPKDIRSLYKKYSEELGEALRETITSVMYKERLLEIINSIKPIIDTLLIKVEDYLSKS